MADDRAGQPFENGEEPEDRDHGAADDAFGSVVFDEAFVRAASFHEPTAAERTLAAAQHRADTEPPAEETYGGTWGPEAYEPSYGGFEVEGYASFRDEHDYREYEAYQEYRDSEDTPGYRGGGQARWHRPVAWVLAVVMGVGVIAMAFAAVSRSSSGERDEPVPPPATTGLDTSVEERPQAAPPLLSGAS